MLTKAVAILLSVSCYFSTATPIHGNLPAEAAKACQEAAGISDADAEILQRSEIVKNESIEGHRCFVACMLTKRGVMHNGKLDIDIMIQVSKQAFASEGRKFDEEAYRKGVSDCNDTAGEGKCVKSYNTWKCFLQFSMQTMMKEGAA
ncbi:hypothetical protein B7P43_G05964 [Cryptotermes secundus]|uniref:General odorant-binding protein 56d n=1 Tax=Cryptotermes secundus TaxID=105785 RepID=A0A2J7PZR9_9NEOP|nr:uncharacterized protein LOC111870770 [Cryptotermes secundus]PNF21833.1 hypothetical protein B7P43_G05964 [Cryptotermes secundus]